MRRGRMGCEENEVVRVGFEENEVGGMGWEENGMGENERWRIMRWGRMGCDEIMRWGRMGCEENEVGENGV